MTEMEREFLRILCGFMHDVSYQLPKGFQEIPELMRLAQIHNVSAPVYEQIRQDKIWQDEQFQMIQGQLKKQSIYTVMSQIQRTESFLKVYRQLNEAGIYPLVVKGIICRNMYSKPDYRISSDEDMLVKKEDFASCDRILLEYGFQRENLDMENLPYEIPYFHSKTGVYIELHFSLFSEDSQEYGFLNDDFSQVFEHAIWEEIQGTKVWTLSPSEHMYYLICHSFKHFLHSGFGIRQVCDMVMMAQHYAGRISWEWMAKKLKKRGMLTFWAGLAEIGRRYLGFDWEQAQYNQKIQKADVGCENLLRDLLQGGVYGNSSMERKHSSNITLAAMKAGRKNTWSSLQASLFPSADYMKKKYAWLQKYPLLLPVGWILRIHMYVTHKEKNQEHQMSGLEIGMERVELLKQYKIIQ